MFFQVIMKLRFHTFVGFSEIWKMILENVLDRFEVYLQT